METLLIFLLSIFIVPLCEALPRLFERDYTEKELKEMDEREKKGVEEHMKKLREIHSK